VDILVPAYVFVAVLVWGIGGLIVWRGGPALIARHPDTWRPVLFALSVIIALSAWIVAHGLRPLDDTQLVSVTGTVVHISDPYRHAGGKQGISTHAVSLATPRGSAEAGHTLYVPARALLRPLGYSLQPGASIDVRMSPGGAVYELTTHGIEILPLHKGRHAQGWQKQIATFAATLLSVLCAALGLMELFWPTFSRALAAYAEVTPVLRGQKPIAAKAPPSPSRW
jgi:hypothetical protein